MNEVRRRLYRKFIAINYYLSLKLLHLNGLLVLLLCVFRANEGFDGYIRKDFVYTGPHSPIHPFGWSSEIRTTSTSRTCMIT